MSRLPAAVLPFLLGAVAAGVGYDLGTYSDGRAAVDALYRDMGEGSGPLGDPVEGTRCSKGIHGCVRGFEHGFIAWTADTGAQPVQGAIGAEWGAGGTRGLLGLPLAPETCGDGACSQQFQRGRISWNAADGTRVARAIDDPADVRVVVNKQRPLVPADWAPGDLGAVHGQPLRVEAAQALQRLIDDAAAEGVPIRAISGYRPQHVQDGLYRRYTALYGQATADAISARPGHSEHQTGLAVDIGNPDGACALQACFDQTPAGQWAAANAHRYGFLIRYPAGAEPVTGYAYEPWHLRYVGTQLAGDVRASGAATLEEYLGLPAAPGY